MSYSRSGLASAAQGLAYQQIGTSRASYPPDMPALVPDPPALAEISDRLDRLIDVASQNLDRITAAGNRSFGMTPEADGSGPEKAPSGGIVDRISTQLTALARIGVATQEAIARIERLV